jgi:hypothetical protein
MEDAISSSRQLLGAFGLRLSHLARTFDAFNYSVTEFGFGEKIPASWQVAHRLSRHMQPLIQLHIDLTPLYGDFTAIIQSTLEHLSFPASPASSSATPTSKTLRTVEHSIRHIVQESRFHMDAMFSICNSDTASSLNSPDIPPDLDSCFSEWFCYFMCIDDDLHDLSRLLDDMFSIAANVSDVIPCVDASHNRTEG